LNRSFDGDIVWVEKELNFEKENYYTKLNIENNLDEFKINELKKIIDSFYKYNNIIFIGKIVNKIIINDNHKIINDNDKIINDNDKIINDSDKMINDNDKIINDNDKMINDSDKMISDSDEMMNYIKNKKNKKIVGILNVKSKYNYGLNKKNNKIYKFYPYDKKYPCFYVSSNINKNKNIKNDVYIEILFKEWKETSIIPTGICERILGEIGNENSEYNYILSIYKFNFINYPNLNKLDLNISENEDEFQNEIMNKKDYSNKLNLNIISIDPEGCKDIDDALSVEIVDNYYLFSVHIADVSSFVKPNTVLDKMAFERISSIYAPHIQINMLPNILSIDKCSLLENKKRLSLTLIFKCDKNFNIIDKYFEKQFIECKFNLNYDIIDILLEEKKKICKKYPLWILNDLKLMKKFIIHNNILNIKENEINSHTIVSSLMVLTNNYVGVILYENKNLQSLLRIHNNYTLKENKFLNILELFNLKKELIKINNEEHLIKLENFLNIFVSKSAMYINNDVYNSANGTEIKNGNEKDEIIFHKGLNIKFYTHFTSPLRRYWDILVHREIKKLLNNKENRNGRENGNQKEKNQLTNSFYKSDFISYINERSKINKLCHRNLNNYELFFKYFNKLEEQILNFNAFIINIKHDNELLLFFPDLLISFDYNLLSYKLFSLYSFTSSEKELKIYHKQKKENYLFHIFDYLNFNIIFNKNEYLDKKIKIKLVNNDFKLFTD
jgi:exosome complex exonuclease DIS3/RRP44